MLHTTCIASRDRKGISSGCESTPPIYALRAEVSFAASEPLLCIIGGG